MRALVLLALLAATGTITGCRSERAAPDSDALVDAEIVRVARLLDSRKSAPEGLQPLVRAHLQSLEASRAAKGSLARLHHLGEAAVGAETLAFLNASEDAGSDVEAFARLWDSRKPAFESPSSPLETGLAVRAMHQRARNRAEKLFLASLPYARISSPGSGLYYLAEAEGNRRFAEFLATLPADRDTRSERSPGAGAVYAALERLDDETLAAFGAESSGSTTIPVSALLKESRELADRGWYDGAALTLLLADVQLRGRNPSTAVTPTSGRQDGSDTLVRMFGELAASDEARANSYAPAMARYAELHRDLPAPAAARNPVTVTLVRWPYT